MESPLIREALCPTVICRVLRWKTPAPGMAMPFTISAISTWPDALFSLVSDSSTNSSIACRLRRESRNGSPFFFAGGSSVCALTLKARNLNLFSCSACGPSAGCSQISHLARHVEVDTVCDGLVLLMVDGVGNYQSQQVTTGSDFG